MNTKVCSKCGETKSLDDYQTDKSKKDGKYSSCKLCVSFLRKSYREENKEKVKKQKKESYKKNVEKISAKNKLYRNIHREKLLIYNKEYYKNNREQLLQRNKDYWVKNKISLNSKYKEYRRKKQEDVKNYQKQYRSENLEKLKEYFKNYCKNRRKNDILFYLKGVLSHRVRSFLQTKNISKTNRTLDIVGCTPLELKIHLEKKFKEGLTWENRNLWHIDHIIPLSSATNELEIYKLCHYTNLQPLWVEENLKKGNKIL